MEWILVPRNRCSSFKNVFFAQPGPQLCAATREFGWGRNERRPEPEGIKTCKFILAYLPTWE